MLVIPTPPPSTSFPDQSMHIVLSIEALCAHMANFIYSFEELKFDTDHFFKSVIELVAAGDSIETTLTLSDLVSQMCSQAATHEVCEVTTYAHLLETAVDDIYSQLLLHGFSEADTICLQYGGMRHQKLHLIKTVDYEYE